MKIAKIYERYKIMPQLQTHMLRVTGVAKIICGNFEKPIDEDSVLSACLLHDMGNIIKSDLTKFPEFFKPQGSNYWLEVKNHFIDKYGTDDHEAALKISKEIGVSDAVLRLIDGIRFSNTKITFNTKNYEIKICHYSDLRAMPFSIGSLKKRLDDLRVRYAKRIKEENWNDFDYLANFIIKVEKQIFARCKIKPEDITEEKVRPLFERLKDFEIETDIELTSQEWTKNVRSIA